MSTQNLSNFAKALGTLIVGIATICSCIFAMIVVPEIRAFLGLPNSEKANQFQQVHLVGYSDLYQIEKYNLGLPDGDQELLDVPFEIGWKINTQCTSTPNNTSEIIITDDIPSPINLYFLLQAGWGLKQYEGNTIGSIDVIFKSGNVFSTELIMGNNIRDWSNVPEAVTTLTSPYARVAHKGVDPNLDKPGQIDMLKVPIPEEYKFEVIDTITIIDSSQPDPCIHLLAITAETQ